MDINQFVISFADQFDNTPIEEFTPLTRFRELGEWDSLISLSILAMIDNKYNVNLPAKEFESAETIDDLYNMVINKVNA